MLEKILTLFTKKLSKKKQAPWSSYQQSTFFDNERSGSLFHRRKKSPLQGNLKKSLHSFFIGQKIILSLISITIILAIWAFLVFWPLFNIDKIFIEKQWNIININQAYSSVDYIRWRNLLFIDTQDLEKRIIKNQNTIKNIRFESAFPKTLNLYLEWYKPLFQTEKYLILENWALVASENFIDDLPNIKVSEDLYERSLFNRVLNSDDLRNIILLQNELSRNIVGFSSKVLYYLPAERELIIKNSIWNLFLFDLTGDLTKQIKGLAVFSKEWGNVIERKYIYIDVRILQKLFVCEYENEFLCRKNLKDIYSETIFQNFPVETSQSEQ